MAETIINIKELSYSYPDGKQALRDINFKASEGEKIALVGANGAGKSTLLYHLNGTFMGTGTIEVGQVAMTKKNMGLIRSMVGLVFQNPDDQLFSPTVGEDVAYGPTYMGLSESEIEDRVDSALRAVNIIDFIHRHPFHLSMGEKKRVSIATVLSMQPKILAFDEPTAGLDPRSRRDLIKLMGSFPQTLLIATHDMTMVKSLAPRMVILNQGKIVADGPTRELMKNKQLLISNGLM